MSEGYLRPLQAMLQLRCYRGSRPVWLLFTENSCGFATLIVPTHFPLASSGLKMICATTTGAMMMIFPTKIPAAAPNSNG
jgi:hypothetical protein